MSGGHWDYKDMTLVTEMFGWDLDCCYGEEGFAQSAKAARVDPLRDSELSEMLWDMFVVMHSADWYLSGDTGEDTYYADVKRFKEKWFGKTEEKRIQHLVDNAVANFKEDLEQSFVYDKED